MKQVTITVHLGTGEKGHMRLESLKTLAALDGHAWNGKPSLGRWLIAMADAQTDMIEQAIKSVKENEL